MEQSVENINKFVLFQSMTKEITALIKQLEADLLNATKNTKQFQIKTPNIPNKLGLFQRVKSLFPKESVGKKRTLKQYVEFNHNTNKLCEDLIKDNFIILENNQVEDILYKFKVEFSKIIKKYGDLLQKDYEYEKQKINKSTGSPDETSAEDIEKTTKKASSDKSRIENGIKLVLQTKNSPKSIDNKWFENGEINPDHYGNVIDYLINNDIDIKNENEIKSVFSGFYNSSKSFYSLLSSVFGNEEINKLINKISLKNIKIGSVEDVIRIYDELRKKNIELAKEAVKYLRLIDEDEENKNEFIEAGKGKESWDLNEPEDLQLALLFNLSINDDLRKSFISQFDY
jgi:hypothetical protein